MKCAELTDDLLLDHADWRLTPAEREAVSRHLDSCPKCQERRDEVELMAGGLKLAAEAPPKALLDGLQPPRPAGREPVEDTPSLGHWLYALAGAAAAILLGFAAYIVLPIGPGATEPPVAQRPTEPAPIAEPPPPAAAVPTPAPAPRVQPPPPPPPKPAEAPHLPVPRKVQAVAQKPAVEPQPPPRPPVLRGDLNGDGRIDVADARALQLRIVRGEPVTATEDLNGDGVVDIADVRHLVRYEVSGR